MYMELESAIKLAIADGKAVFGAKRCIELAEKKKAKAIVYASNAPLRERIASLGVKTYRFNGSSLELGQVCGKPFSVSALAILDENAAAFLGE
jgi:large subunit ribosomal protein L30e